MKGWSSKSLITNHRSVAAASASFLSSSASPRCAAPRKRRFVSIQPQGSPPRPRTAAFSFHCPGPRFAPWQHSGLLFMGNALLWDAQDQNQSPGGGGSPRPFIFSSSRKPAVFLKNSCCAWKYQMRGATFGNTYQGRPISAR